VEEQQLFTVKLMLLSVRYGAAPAAAAAAAAP
jgi:hypothetical protein